MKTYWYKNKWIKARTVGWYRKSLPDGKFEFIWYAYDYSNNNVILQKDLLPWYYPIAIVGVIVSTSAIIYGLLTLKN